MAQETVVVGEGNQPPAVADDVYAIEPNQTALLDVLANDLDPEQDTLTLIAVDTAGIGKATIVANRIAYTPPPGFAGQVVLLYTVRDAAANERAGRATVHVAGINYFPLIGK